MTKLLLIDGMLNGTGIRDQLNGGYIEPESLGITPTLIKKLQDWHLKYQEEFYNGYSNTLIVDKLDELGRDISNEIQKELTEFKVSYFSDAKMSNT